MSEKNQVKCPNCKEVFKVDDSVYTDIVKQVRDQQFNEELNKAFDGTKDYVSLHYRLNSRTDTRYWQDNRERGAVSDSLQHLIQTWDGSESFDKALQVEKTAQAYLRPSWYCIFSGMGRYPEIESSGAAFHAAANRARRLCERSAKKFQPHELKWLMSR